MLKIIPIRITISEKLALNKNYNIIFAIKSLHNTSEICISLLNQDCVKRNLPFWQIGPSPAVGDVRLSNLRHLPMEFNPILSARSTSAY